MSNYYFDQANVPNLDLQIGSLLVQQNSLPAALMHIYQLP